MQYYARRTRTQAGPEKMCSSDQSEYGRSPKRHAGTTLIPREASVRREGHTTESCEYEVHQKDQAVWKAI